MHSLSLFVKFVHRNINCMLFMVFKKTSIKTKTISNFNIIQLITKTAYDCSASTENWQNLLKTIKI